jgi:uncharacterized protein DUF3592
MFSSNVPLPRSRWGWRLFEAVEASAVWVVASTFLAFAIGLLVWLPFDYRADQVLQERGVRTVATVEEVDPSRPRRNDDADYLLTFQIDGTRDQQWTGDVPTMAEGAAVEVIVDPEDHRHIEAVSVFDRRTGGYIATLAGAVVSGVFGGWMLSAAIRMRHADRRAPEADLPPSLRRGQLAKGERRRLRQLRARGTR